MRDSARPPQALDRPVAEASRSCYHAETMHSSPWIETRLVLVGLTAVVAFASACSSSKAPRCTGALRCDCYANHTCDDGFVCLSNMCVAPESNGTGGVFGGNGGVSAVPPQGTGGAISSTGGSVSTGIPGVGGATIPPVGGGGNVAPVGTGGLVAVGGSNAGASIASTGGVAATGGVVSKTGGTTGTGGGTASPYITEKDGWATDPAHQVQGPVYTVTDKGGSNIYPVCTSVAGVGSTCFNDTSATTQFCASGTVALALTPTGANCQLTSDTCDWSSYWGAALNINLNQPLDATDGVAWNASSYSGVSFDITISAMPPNLRLYVNLLDGTQYCYAISTSKTYTLTWSQFRRDCYTTGGATLSGTLLTQIKSLAWQAGTDASAAHAFDFCVDHVKIN